MRTEVTIKKILFVGKWAEVWTQEPTEDRRYDVCCKAYMLERLIDAADLHEHIWNHGYAGLHIVGERIVGNWEPTKITAPVVNVRDPVVQLISSWIETKVKPPIREDGTREEGLVWTWTNLNSPTAQKKAYNSTLWSEVVAYPTVYPLWTPIIEIETFARPYA